MTIPRERPTLFCGQMVMKIRADEKTQTRRLLKFPKWLAKGFHEHAWPDNSSPFGPCLKVPMPDETVQRLFSPYGLPRLELDPTGPAGDRLWVKESWRAEKQFDKRKPTQLKEHSYIWYEAGGSDADVIRRGNLGKLRPSLFMRRWMAREMLELLVVRVQRLQDLSEEDAKAEGVEPFFSVYTSIGRDQRLTSGELAADCEYRASYAVLWDELNADRGATWKLNPWVWALTFRRLWRNRG